MLLRRYHEERGQAVKEVKTAEAKPEAKAAAPTKAAAPAKEKKATRRKS